jgi:hypothetical protein
MILKIGQSYVWRAIMRIIPEEDIWDVGPTYPRLLRWVLFPLHRMNRFIARSDSSELRSNLILVLDYPRRSCLDKEVQS